MNDQVARILEQLIGIPCSWKEAGHARSLTIGFGAEVGSPLNLSGKTHREWEIVTYYNAWRIVRAGVVLCGSQDAVDSVDELNASLGRVDLGRFLSLRQVTDLDVRIEFDSGVSVDLLATTSDDDECFHIRGPAERLVKFSVRGGWRTGRSDSPWLEST